MVRQKIGIEQLDGESIHGDTCEGEEIIDTPYTQLDRLSHCACSRIVAMSMVSLLHGIPDVTCGVNKVLHRNDREIRTSLSTLSPSPRTGSYPSCTNAQYPAPTGPPGWDP
jgi:hypothetical protein